METPNLYAVLGVEATADQEAIRRAYKQQAQIHHPDRPTGSEEKFKQLQHAYNVLSDPERRARYDATGETEERKPEEQAAEEQLAALFNELIDRGDFEVEIVQKCIKVVNDRIADAGQHIAEGRDIKRSLEQQLGRVQRKADHQLFDTILQSKIRQVDEKMAILEADIRIQTKVLGLLKDHKDGRPPIMKGVRMVAWPGFGPGSVPFSEP